MNIVLAWLVIVLIAAAFSFVPPMFTCYDNVFSQSYWNDWVKFNVIFWGFVVAAVLISLGLLWALTQLGVV